MVVSKNKEHVKHFSKMTCIILGELMKGRRVLLEIFLELFSSSYSNISTVIGCFKNPMICIVKHQPSISC